MLLFFAMMAISYVSAQATTIKVVTTDSVENSYNGFISVTYKLQSGTSIQMSPIPVTNFSGSATYISNYPVDVSLYPVQSTEINIVLTGQNDNKTISNNSSRTGLTSEACVKMATADWGADQGELYTAP